VGKTTGVAVPKVAVSGAIPRTGTYTPTGSRTAGAIARPGTVYGSSRTSGYGTGGYRTGSYGTGGYGKESTVLESMGTGSMAPAFTGTAFTEPAFTETGVTEWEAF
jgi:hypothetical protein